MACYHGLSHAGVFTSEDARAYKPRAELFNLVLISIGIKPLWLNRFGKEVPEGIEAISKLTEALNLLSNDMKKHPFEEEY